jgi:hypothetical protein
MAAAHRQPPHRAASALRKSNPPPYPVLLNRMNKVLRLEPARETTRAIDYVVCVKHGVAVWHSREVALEHEDYGRVLQSRDLPHFVYVPDD